MSTRTIPAQTIVTCDCCKRSGTRRVKSAAIVLHRNALDWHGDPVADGTIRFDLCDECESLIAKAINAVAEEQMKNLNP